MCGIVACPGHHDLTAAVAALAHRGPDGHGITEHAQCTLGHTRLAVRDPLPRSGQPFRAGPVMIAYNGELYNDAAVRAEVDQAGGWDWATTGDTETVAAALAVLGPETALPLFEGMFAIAWADGRDPGVLSLARDRMGEVPLHVHLAPPVTAASELKAFLALGRRCGDRAADVPAGSWWRLTSHGTVSRVRFARLDAAPGPPVSLAAAAARARAALGEAVAARAVADVPVCTLLSGGIDSAIIAAELRGCVPDLTCYTAVLDPKSRDLRSARLVADALGVKLAEVRIPVPTADDLAATVGQIEMPHKAQAEIGWPCLQLAAAIRSDGFRVTYSGEGSDELWGSYGFAYHGITAKGWYAYRRELVAGQARKNFPRVNKAFLSRGVEARLPFLAPAVVDLALHLEQAAVADGRHPKAILRDGYDGILPGEILARPKAAFQDQLGIKQVIGQMIDSPARFYRAEYARRYG